MREICDHRHAWNRAARGSSRVVREAHTGRSEYPVQRWKEWEEDSSHKDRPEAVSYRALVKGAQALVTQEKAPLEGIVQKIASQAKSQRCPIRVAVQPEKSSEGTEKHAARSNHEAFR